MQKIESSREEENIENIVAVKNDIEKKTSGEAGAGAPVIEEVEEVLERVGLALARTSSPVT